MLFIVHDEILTHLWSDDDDVTDEVIADSLSDDDVTDEGGFFSGIKYRAAKFWKATRNYTAEKLKSAIENILKKPLNLIFKKRYKTRKRDGEKVVRCWIEARGSEEALAILEKKQQEIENQLHLSLVV